MTVPTAYCLLPTCVDVTVVTCSTDYYRLNSSIVLMSYWHGRTGTVIKIFELESVIIRTCLFNLF